MTDDIPPDEQGVAVHLAKAARDTQDEQVRLRSRQAITKLTGDRDWFSPLEHARQFVFFGAFLQAFAFVGVATEFGRVLVGSIGYVAMTPFLALLGEPIPEEISLWPGPGAAVLFGLGLLCFVTAYFEIRRVQG